MKLILASASPRRKEILSSMGYQFQVEPSNIEERQNPELPPKEIAADLARQKAVDISKKYPNEIVLGADTIVVLDDKVLGKPKDEDDAFCMLQSLRGREHQVITGVALVKNEKIHCFSVTTKVWMMDASDEQLKAYVRTKEPLDKAGSYGIQGKGALLVEKIEGDYFNVVGLPIQKIAHVLSQKFQIEVMG
ncbi:septum formation inhibitor Maf [Clostridia bacterium]|nr:septum formation inhibitor Maf [Clostridia bacterium]